MKAKKILSLLALILFVVLCMSSYLQASSDAKYVGGTLVQGAAPDPDDGYSYKVLTDTVGYFSLENKIWWEFWSPKDCKGWILSTNDKEGKTSFTIPAYERTSYIVNPKTTFFGYSSCTGMEIKSQ